MLVSRRFRVLAPATLVALAIGLAWVLQAVSAGASGGGAQVTARGVLTGGGSLAAVTAATGGADTRSAAAAGVVDPLGTVGSVQVTARARRDGTGSAASGAVSARDLSLLGGRVMIGRLRMTARAAADGTQTRAELVEVTAQDATLDGAPLTLGPGSRVDVPGAGVVLVGEVSSDTPGGLRVNGVRVVADAADAGGLVVGHVDLLAVAGPGAVRDDRPAPSPDPDLAQGPSATPPAEESPATSPPAPSTPAPVTTAPVTTAPATVPEAPVTTPATGPAPRLLPGTPGAATVPVRPAGPAFPVAGETSYGDDYGAARAGTGWHQGNDLFAAVGTPVVAVADGTISKVGWNTLGGNRLWLTDTAGTGYYYAHLSAYAPVAFDGSQVRAGEVIAYVGNTGQAATTPPHLHFEVHPGGMDADPVDPYALLRAWESGGVTAFAADTAVEAAPDAAAGAVMVGVAPEVDTPPAAASGSAVSAR
ncbi:MAG: peptidoglycan DD-metalloendopeptidase family protein [Thermoleophilia bacterium]|nr:peptidoglycan DD-metalloendopeptidase family protein [Thermoleophilia bacterium]